MGKGKFILPILVVAIFLGLSSVFVVDEREKALVLQFGQIKSVKEEPGLNFKIPFIQEVVRYDARILSLDTDTIEVTPSDDRRLVVDAFARYRIRDVVQFRQAVGVGGIRMAEDRLSSILNAQIREVLGADQVTSDTILSEERRSLMLRIRQQAQRSAEGLGLDVVDVRLKQTNLPDQNLEATFARMRAEREREAADEIARGNAVFAEAFGADPEFFAFYRSMEAYEKSLGGENSMLVMTPDGEFFDYFRSGSGSE
jgi:membrane protease subunit HflC